MTAGELGSLPRDLLRIVEGFGLTGTWSWTFATDEHVWSPGLYRILGLEPQSAQATYGLLLALVHPEDRHRVAAVSRWLQAGEMAPQTFRIVRPDGTHRTVMSRGEVTEAPDGRPLRATGVLVDVSDREMLARAQAAERRRKRAIFDRLGAFTSSSATYPYTDFSDEWLDLTGLPKQVLLAEPTLPVLKSERAHWRDHGRQLYLTRQIVYTQPRLMLASGETVSYRMVMVPMLDAAGAVESWTNYVAPLHLPGLATGAIRDGLELFVAGRHVRAGRALLDWSMSQLAEASGLSVSTVRRLENDDPSISKRIRHKAVAALRGCGIVFSLMEDGTFMVGSA